MKSFFSRTIFITMSVILAAGLILIGCNLGAGMWFDPAGKPSTDGLEYTLINGGTEYSVSAGDVHGGSVVIAEYWLGKKVTAIGEKGFINNGIKSVTIPSGVNSIGVQAFEDNTEMTTVIVNAVVPPTAGTNFFFGCNSLLAIRVPSGSVTAYKNAAGWSTYLDIIVSQ